MLAVAMAAGFVIAALAQSDPAPLDSGYVVALHLVSLHDKPCCQILTPGVSVRSQSSGYMMGTLDNSTGERSYFAGRMFETDDKHWALGFGMITGYKRATVLPFITPSVHFDLGDDYGARFSILPRSHSTGADAIHFMLEKTLK